MNKVTLALAGTALALGAAIPSLIGGYMWGAAEMETISRAPVCTVEDQKLANYQRGVELGEEIEKLQDMKMRLSREAASLKLDIESAEMEYKELKLYVDLQEARMSSAKILADETGKQVRAANVKKSAFD